MGYRSDVRILIYGVDEDVTAFVAGEKLKGHKGMPRHPLDASQNKYHERNIYRTSDSTSALMEFNWWHIKWYDTYPEIAYWVNLESIWEDAFKNTTLCMEIARIGEDVTDVVVNYYGDCDFFLNINQEIANNMDADGYYFNENSMPVLNEEDDDEYSNI